MSTQSDVAQNVEVVASGPTNMALVEAAKLDGAVAWAFAHPRKMLKVIDECRELVLSDLKFAENSFYFIPGRQNRKTGTTSEPFTGPNIRLAELFMSTVANVAVGVGFSEIDRANKVVRVRAFIQDLEKNTRVEEEYTSRILFGGADGEKNALDRARAYAIRNAVVRLFGPQTRRLAEEAMAFVEKNTDVEGARLKLVKIFEGMGVEEAALLKWCDVDSIEKLEAQHITKLRGVYQAITNGYTSVDEQFFPDRKTKDNVEGEVDLESLKDGGDPGPREKKKGKKDNPTTEPDNEPETKGEGETDG